MESDQLILAIAKWIGAGASAVLLTVSGVLITRGIAEKLAEIKARRAAFEAHIKTCAEKDAAGEVAKQHIIEKLDGFGERMDGLHTKVVKLGESQERISKQVNILVGRQMERDRA